MTDEFEQFKRTLLNINRQQFNTAYSLVGKIVDYTPNMQYCSVEVQMNGGKHTFPNIPAHGYPVKGSTGIIHFHNGNLEQPVCDCAYRLNPPQETLKEYATDSCWNYHNNGNFIFDLEGYTVGPSTDSVSLYDEAFTNDGKSCGLIKNGSYLEFTVDISKSQAKYIKFQCNYRGTGVLKVECFNPDTGKTIQTAPKDIGKDYVHWNSNRGRFGWVYNKETYLRVDDDTEYKKLKFRITNVSQSQTVFSGGEEVEIPTTMTLDGILVFDENGGTKFYNSENDSLKLFDLISN